MKITCTQENLSSGLAIVSHVASKNISLPILNNVLLKAEKGGLSLMTTNLEIGVVTQVRGKVSEEGAVTVQAKTLSDYVGLLPSGNVELESVEQTLHVRSIKAKTTMKGVDPAEFPLIPEVEAKREIIVPAATLKEALTSVAFAVAYDETRPEISGVFMQFTDMGIILAATDSYRLAERTVSVKTGAADYRVIIPMRTAQELIRILSEADDQVTIRSNENQIVFIAGPVTLTSRVIEGQYPDYKQIIPSDSITRAQINTRAFANTVKQASLFCKPGSNDVQLVFDQPAGRITVSAANVQIGESQAEQDAIITGQSNDIIFNHRFLQEGLQNIATEECVLELTTNSSPGLLKPKDASDYLYIIMPIKQ
ncbi:MAG: DNA polymerase III subunit beta [Patescibacteria group bacterium]